MNPLNKRVVEGLIRFKEYFMLKNRLSYGAVVIVLFVFILLRDSPMTYTAFYAAIILPIISFIMGHLTKQKTMLVEELSREFVMKNEKIEYKVKILNHGFLPCFLAYIRFDFKAIGLDANFEEAYLAIKPFDSSEIEMQISGKYRGIYHIGIPELITYDFLGIFKFRTRYENPRILTIAPEIISIPELTSEVTQLSETVVKRHMKGQDHTISAELREHQLTDSFKQIHWKATAKRNELISKNPQEIEQLSTIFFISNLRIPQSIEKMLEQEDKFTSALVTTISHCHQLGYRIALTALNEKNVGHTTEFTTNFTRLYHDVATMPFGKFGQINHLLNDYLNSGNVLENIFLFTQAINTELINSLRGFKILGSHVTIFLFGSVTENNLKQLELLDIHCIQLDY